MTCAQMKVMIAYDGSSHAKTAINELGRAGLPPDSEILINCKTPIPLDVSSEKQHAQKDEIK